MKDLYLPLDEIDTNTSIILMNDIPVWIHENEDVLFKLIASWTMLKIPVIELQPDNDKWLAVNLVHVSQNYKWISAKEIQALHQTQPSISIKRWYSNER